MSHFSFTAIFKPVNTVNFLLSKDSIPLLDRSDVYCVPYEWALSYINQIKKTLNVVLKNILFL